MSIGIIVNCSVNQSINSINFNFLQTVVHSATLVCEGPSIYKMKAKILKKQKSTYF